MSSDIILVTDYLRNDLDGVACIYSYSEFLQRKGVNAIGATFTKPHREAQFVIDSFKIKKLGDADKIIGTCDGVILVDASDVKGISPKIAPSRVIEIIDHRKMNEAEKFPNAKVQIEFVGSAATLIAEKFYKSRIPISKESAILLALAIVSNTINFKAGVTTERDKRMYKWLGPKAKIPKNFAHKMFVHKSKFNKPLKNIIEEDFASLRLGNKEFGIAQLEIVGVEKFVNNNLENIRKILFGIKKKKSQDFIFLTCIDVEKGFNIFVTIDEKTEKLISSTFRVKFVEGVAKRPGVIMRKEITPLIKGALL